MLDEDAWMPTSLVGRVEAGEQWAWDALVERHAQAVWDVARGLGLDPDSAGDVALLTWSRLVDHIGRLVSDDEVGPWLCTMARREATALSRLHTAQR